MLSDKIYSANLDIGYSEESEAAIRVHCTQKTEMLVHKIFLEQVLVSLGFLLNSSALGICGITFTVT